MGVDLYHFLFRVLAASLGRNVYHRAFQHFEKGLLYAFTRHIPGDRRIIAFAGDFIDLINEHYPFLGCFDIVICNLQKPGQYAFNILSNISGLGQRSGISNTKRHIEHLRNASCKESFTGTGFTDNDDVGLFEFNIVVLGFFSVFYPLVMIVNSY